MLHEEIRNQIALFRVKSGGAPPKYVVLNHFGYAELRHELGGFGSMELRDGKEDATVMGVKISLLPDCSRNSTRMEVVG